MREVPLQGDLSGSPFPNVLMCLNRQRLTGTLVVTAEQVVKKVYFDKGSAIFASSSFEDDRLGEMLVKSGKITVEQYDRSVELLKKTGKRQGAILVDLGYITPKELFWGVKYQVREIIYSCFHFDKGAYEFSEGRLPSEEVITLKMSMGNLIYEGVKRIDNWTRIRKELPATESVMKLSDDPLSLFQEVEFTPQDKKILSLVDGKRTIKQITEDSWLNSFEAMKIIYVLWSIGILTEKKVEATGISLDDIFRPAAGSEDALRKRVGQFYQKLPSMSPHQLLEVEPGATLDQIRKSYYRLAKEYHPDRFYDSDDQALKERLSAIFDAVTDAYNALKDAALKREGMIAFELDGLEEPKAREPQAQKPQAARPVRKAPDKKAEAESAYKAGLNALKKSDLAGAVSHLREAVGLQPENAEYWSHLALALSRDPSSGKEAEKAMLEAVRLEPANSDYHTNLGLLYLRAKASAKARKEFETALALNPVNARAKQAMKQILN